MHQWVPGNRAVPWPHCSICGIIRRRDKKNSKNCKGSVRIGSRKIQMINELTVPSERELKELSGKYPLLIVTPRMFHEGYCAGKIDLPYEAIGKTTDGNVIVVDPRGRS